MRVLLVEDQPDLALFGRAMLESEGFEVTVVNTDFKQVLCPAVWVGVDVVVCDLMLPDVDGLDVLAYARAQFPQVRRVVWSAVEWKANDDPGIADAVLTKPSSIENILAAIRGSRGRN